MCRPLDLMEFHLNNGQTSAVRIRHGLGGDTVGLPKSARMYKGCTRDVQGMYKGCTRDVQGMYKGCTRDVQGMYKGCTRDVQGMYKGCTRDVQGMYKGYPRDIQGIPKGTTRLQHRPNTVATPWQFRVSVQSANGVPSSPEPPDPAQRPAAPAGRVPTRRLGCEISGLKFRAAQCAVVKADLPHVAVEEFGQRGLVAGEPRAEQQGRWIIIEPEQRHLPTALPSTNRRNR